MKVFLSWSGDRSRAVAAALHTLLPDMLQDVSTWMSEHDINAGARWSETLNAQLELSNFGILCLTPENLNAPWLLYEAGSIAKSVTDSRVVPYLLDLKTTDVTYPLAQFQGVEASEEGTLKLIRAMNSSRGEPMPDERLTRVFARWWPDLERKLSGIMKITATLPTPRNDRAILEEILQLVRADKTPPPIRDQVSTNSQPSSIVWKTVHQVSEAELSAMSLPELVRYIDAIRHRYIETTSLGEESALERKENLASAELARRGETEKSARDTVRA